MPKESSFDIISEVDLQAVDNAVNSANRELTTRFDFRGSVSRLEFDKKEGKLTLFSDDEQKLKSVIDILQSRFVRQSIALNALDFQKIEVAEKSTVRQEAKVQQGIPSDKAKEIIRTIKDQKIKVTPSLQGDHVRVTGKSKNDLQHVMSVLNAKDFGLPLQYNNYR